MRWIFKLIIQILANAVLIGAIAYFMPQLTFKGGLVDYLIIGAILGIANLIIKS